MPSKIIYILLGILTINISIIFYYRRPYIKRFRLYKVSVYSAQHVPDLKIEYVIVTETNGQIIVEVIYGPGQNNVQVMTGEKAKQFLERIGLN